MTNTFKSPWAMTGSIACLLALSVTCPTYAGEIGDPGDPLEPVGACCHEYWGSGMICEMLTEHVCSDYQGYWYGPNVSCNDLLVDCDTAGNEEGACCYEDPDLGPTCTEVSQAQCNDLPGSYWYGLGVPCSDPQVECAQSQDEEGACCYEDADGTMVCIETTAAICDVFLNGTWYGLGVLCSDAQVECDVSGGHVCTVEPGSECAGRPDYADPDFSQVFGHGQVAVQTASPNIFGGHVVKIYDLSDINSAPLNNWFALNRYSDPDWTQWELGSVFGLAVDDDGDIFVTSTRSWNYDYVGSGGWGAVYRLDRVTGDISVFATLPNVDSGLGSITWDCDHQVFFVSNMEDGRIYRLDTSGNVLDWFDPAAAWTGMPGPVALGDRPWAVEVHAGRLYYSMWNEHFNNGAAATANEIWSVQLDSMGMPVGSETLEISLPAKDNFEWSSPVADMRFTPRGSLLLAERTQINFDTLTAHHSRVLEYECQDGAWVPSGNTFSVGEINGENATGGVDADVERTWAGGDALHLGHPAPYANLYGFAGLPALGGTVADSVLIDYQDNTGIQDKTMIGDLVVTLPGEPCPGDLNGDGTLGIDDLLILIGNWGTGGIGDINADGVVNIEDLLLILNGFGPC
ncbi:MAG: hypothetical protein VX527_05425 [Planctomycetota bacterium]|nr:hypothetical protein [Planctomycetota bacterium]